ncbi:hypothetical protein T12_3672 [Trichinella patagoniensis]|uniref:Uncharacterized protein n=1 Tax=Trichinella patagoniensis TaxID=990121 RepID=A0A0V0ZZZ4_9BILA|nr:hypothetical protein T12_3672 [Trichinella patagoniensis]
MERSNDEAERAFVRQCTQECHNNRETSTERKGDARSMPAMLAAYARPPCGYLYCQQNIIAVVGCRQAYAKRKRKSS